MRATSVASVLVVASFTSRSKCSTPAAQSHRVQLAAQPKLECAQIAHNLPQAERGSQDS